MNRGFTLVELLIGVAIVAVLVLCAVPSFQGAQQRVRRSDARFALLNVQLQQERFLFDNGRYAATLSELGGGADASRSPDGHYDLELRAADGRFWEIVATPAPGGRQQDDRTCRVFSLDSSGRRGAAGSPDAIARCWA